MYLERPNKRAESLARILLLIVLIGAGVYILSSTGPTAKPPTPTPAPTRTASAYIADAERYAKSICACQTRVRSTGKTNHESTASL